MSIVRVVAKEIAMCGIAQTTFRGCWFVQKCLDLMLDPYALL